MPKPVFPELPPNTTIPLRAAPDRVITRVEELPPPLAASLDAEEKALIARMGHGGLPFAVTPHFASLAGAEKDDPIRKQFVPDILEERGSGDPFALDDPLGEARFRLTPRLVHQYPSRALLLAGGACAGFCRYCFRRVRMGRLPEFISAEELEPALACLKARSEIREILVSGGDPLTADDNELGELFGKLRKARPGILIRLCTRVPVTCPSRLTRETIAMLASYAPIKIATHINHPKELAPEARDVLAAAVKAGIPVLVQTVLLRGINDSAETLAALFRECLALGLSPYYLFQLDLAPGTAHFRVPLLRGLAIYRELERLAAASRLAVASRLVDVSGIPAASGLAPETDIPARCLPKYAVDLPGGGGKIRLTKNAIAGEEETPVGKVFLLKDAHGTLWKYPVD